MKLSPILFFFLGLTLFSCDLEGVKTSDNDDHNIVANDTSGQYSMENITDSAATETPFSLLKDSIGGQPNEMVYQREDGLRVEWTVKNNDPIELNDVVMVNYEARVAGGEVYDSNEELGEPVPLKSNIGMMVPGLEAGLLKMNIGDVGRIMIPNALGYGEDGYVNVVPPGANLIVEIEIVKRIEPVVLDEGVKVYTWKKNDHGTPAEKNKLITFDYFAFTKGNEAYMYDNSYKNSQPFSFKLENDNVIDGLHQGMKTLKSEESAFIEIPYKLAYGNKGLVDLVPKKTDIVYDVRIISID